MAKGREGWGAWGFDGVVDLDSLFYIVSSESSQSFKLSPLVLYFRAMVAIFPYIKHLFDTYFILVVGLGFGKEENFSLLTFMPVFPHL